MDGLLFTGNQITAPPAADAGGLNKPVSLTDCTNVRIEQNQVSGSAGLTIELRGMTEKDIQTDWKSSIR
ncbi:hypothetical protein [Niabella sp.]|uniref:hypothetical protein n=1 Tax=Niabella sp. TaxID=1962976 RepID=UPI00261AD783|nr:hypothetical protein [Niabella sp.]